MYQIQFLFSRPGFYLGLPFKSRRAIRMPFGIDDPHYLFGFRVMAAHFIFMLVKTPLYIGRYARVERAIGAFENVDEIHNRYTKLFDELRGLACQTLLQLIL